MVNETILAIIIAFAISAALCPVVIPFLHRLKFGPVSYTHLTLPTNREV